MTETPGFPTRRAALQLLDAVLRRGLPLESTLAGTTRALAGPDKALARAIASETLRWLPDLDDLIDSATRLRLADDAKARMVLRMLLVQVLILKTPPHAALATGLPLLEGGPRRLVHGVTSALLRRNAALPEWPNLPYDVDARWRATWGDAMVGQARMALAERAPIDLTLKDHGQTADWAERLGGETLAPGHARLPADSDVTKLPGFDNGDWWVQGLAASVPARLFGAGDGRALIDLCAAPGGKTLQLAAAGWKVTALDSDAKRMERIGENLARTRLLAKLIVQDVLSWAPPAPVDAILLDAPCSATGTFARHPEVLHRARAQDIAAMADLQTAMITRAADWLAPGGTMVYATCSLEPAEGEAQLSAAQAAGLVLDPITDAVAGFAPSPEGWLRILPRPGIDGFFVMRLRKP
jgi:16S rRNA (cytosine967-C5)-methyltransferase